MTVIVVAVTALAIALGGCAAHMNPLGPAGSVIDEVAGRAIGEGNVAGLVVVVARDSTVVFERGYGRANVQTDEPMTREAVLDYFSIGKHATAAILLRLTERGELNLDAPARLYLPEADFEGYDVTTRQLLSHTSGLWEAERDENQLPASYRRPPPDGAILAWANQGERLAAPGETWMYSGGGFLFAGEIAERLTGRTFEQLIDEELAGPLGLKHFMGCADTSRDREPAYYVEAGEIGRIAESEAHRAGVEYFLGIGSGGAQWFAYDRHGFPDDVAVRVNDDCS